MNKDTQDDQQPNNSSSLTQLFLEHRNNHHYDKRANNLIKLIMEKSIHCSKSTLSSSILVLAAVISQDTAKFKSLCIAGLPDDLQILRSLAWKINLGLLPIDSDKWDSILIAKRKEYATFKQVIISKLKQEKGKFEKVKERKEDLDLFYLTSNKKLLEQIEKDVNRTHMQLSFFFQPTNKKIQLTTEEFKEMMQKRKNCNLKSVDDTYKVDIVETHADVIARILFSYSKFFPEVSYNQGMNEIIAPIYYCYSHDKFYEEESESDIEADTFWSFYYLMNELKNVFQNEEDDPKGLVARAFKFEKVLSVVDKELYDHLARVGVKYSYFCYRWFILLFSQDFNLIDIMRLWDMLFTTKDKYYYVYYVALAFIEVKRPKIIKGELSDIIPELQDFSAIEINDLASLALRLQELYSGVIDPIISLTD